MTLGINRYPALTPLAVHLQRAKEAVSINQSLLSLGRVISSLMNKNKHQPYRDSSLTRFMKEW